MTRALLACLLVGCGTTAAVPDLGPDLGRDLGPDPGPDAASIDAGSAADSGEVPDGGPASFVYVGLATGDLVTLDARTLTERSRTHTGDFPSFVAPAPDGRHLYAVNENDDEVVALSVAGDGTTSVVSRQAAAGGPTHVSIGATGRFVFTASYGSGEVRVFPVAADGTLSASVATDLAGAHAHEAVPDGDHLFVPCLGADQVVTYSVDATTGALARRSMVATDAGAGPRHLALSPDGAFAYLIDELGSQLDVLGVDAATGALTRIQTVSTLPPGTTGANACAEVLVSSDGRFVYGSNRGHDSVVVFARDATTGRVTSIQDAPCGGMHPRSMALSLDGARLLVANRDSDVIAVFGVGSDGRLTAMTTVPMVGMPYFVAEMAM